MATSTTWRQDEAATLAVRDFSDDLKRMNVDAESLAVDSSAGGGGIQVIRGDEIVARNAALTERRDQTVGGEIVNISFDASAGGEKVVRFKEPSGAPGAFAQLLAVGSGVSIVLVDNGGDTSNDAVRIGNVPGDGTRDLTCRVLTETSDRATKKNIKSVGSGALDAVMALKPRVFERREGGNLNAGFVAQEVAEHIPMAVAGEEGDLSLSSMALLTYAVAAIQDQQKQIDELRKRLDREV